MSKADRGRLFISQLHRAKQVICYSKWLARADPKTHYLRLALANEEKMGGISKPCALLPNESWQLQGTACEREGTPDVGKW